MRSFPRRCRNPDSKFDYQLFNYQLKFLVVDNLAIIDFINIISFGIVQRWTNNRL